MLVNRGTLDTLFTSFNAAFREGYGQAPADHERFTMMVTSMTSTEEYAFLGQWPGLKEWVGERVLRGIADHEYSIKNKKFESTIEVDRDKIEDDQYGVYAPMFREAGYASAAHPCELVYAALKDGFTTKCFDGQFFFDTDHPVAGGTQSNDGGGNGDPWFLIDTRRMLKPIIHQTRRPYNLTRLDDLDDENVFMRDQFLYGIDGRCNVGYGLWQLAYGSKQTLDETAYRNAREAMMAYKADEGRPLGIMPNLLVVGPGNEHEALEILKAERQSDGATNVYMGTAELLVTPWLQ